MSDSERLLDQLRPAAFAIAYQMLGSVSEAEDVVQEALLRVRQALDRSFGSTRLRCSASSRPMAR
jgi:RNA polymerase sigma-70 factor (ECF subfamily)